jgi:hypothetical protein
MLQHDLGFRYSFTLLILTLFPSHDRASGRGRQFRR